MSKKPPEIERTPGGGLPRMTPAQRRRANALVRKTCCNYDNGNCLDVYKRQEINCSAPAKPADTAQIRKISRTAWKNRKNSKTESKIIKILK